MSDMLTNALKAIAQGYKVKTENDRWILVENPNYKPDNGENPYFCLDTNTKFVCWGSD